MKTITLSVPALAAYLIDLRNSLKQQIVLGLTGHIGEGKTTVSLRLTKYLNDEGYSVRIDSIASNLKKLIQAVAYTTKNQIEKNLDNFAYYNDEILSEIISAYHMDIEKIVQSCNNDWRCLAQKLGEKLRCLAGKDFWVNLLYRQLKGSNADIIIINDVRYLNEAEFLKNHFDNFLLVRVKRSIDSICKSLGIDQKTYYQWLQHESEKEIDQLPVDFIVNNERTP